MSATKIALGMINSKIEGKTKAEKSAKLRVGFAELLKANSRAVLNFGSGYRALNPELATANGLDAIIAAADANDYFTLFVSTEEKHSRSRGAKPVAVSWPFNDSLAGLVGLVGNRGGGKTTYMEKELGVDIFIRTGEPVESADADARVIHAWDSEEAFSLAIICAISGLRAGIDGMRELIFNSVGNATSGGIDSNVYTFLTVMSNIIAGAGTSLVVAINPMTEKAFSEVVGSIISSISGVLTFADGALIGKTYRGASGRTFSEGALNIEQDEPVGDIGSSITGSIGLDESAVNAPVLPFGAADFDDDELPVARQGSRVTISQ